MALQALLVLAARPPLPVDPDGDPHARKDPFLLLSREELRTRWSLTNYDPDDDHWGAEGAPHLSAHSAHHHAAVNDDPLAPHRTPRPLTQRLSAHKFLDDTTFIEVRLAGFDGSGENEVQLNEELVQKLLDVSLGDDVQHVLEPPGSAGHELPVRRRFLYRVTPATASLAESISAAVGEHVANSTGGAGAVAVPLSVVDSLVRDDYKRQRGSHVTLYLLSPRAPRRPPTDAEQRVAQRGAQQGAAATSADGSGANGTGWWHKVPYSYVDDQPSAGGEHSPACPLTRWVGRERYLWVDLTAGPVAYGPSSSAGDVVTSHTLPSVASLARRFTESKPLHRQLAVEMSALVVSTCSLLLAPPLAWLAERLHTHLTVVVLRITDRGDAARSLGAPARAALEAQEMHDDQIWEADLAELKAEIVPLAGAVSGRSHPPATFGRRPSPSAAVRRWAAGGPCPVVPTACPMPRARRPPRLRASVPNALAAPRRPSPPSHWARGPCPPPDPTPAAPLPLRRHSVPTCTQGQHVSLESFDTSLADCPLCAAAYAAASVTDSLYAPDGGGGGRTVVRTHLRGAELAASLRRSLADLPGLRGRSMRPGERVLPVVVYSVAAERPVTPPACSNPAFASASASDAPPTLSRRRPASLAPPPRPPQVLLDRVALALPSKDFVVAVQTRPPQRPRVVDGAPSPPPPPPPPSLRLDERCAGGPVHLDAHAIRRPLLAALLHAGWGAVPTHTAWSRARNASVTRLLWAASRTPHGPYSARAEFSFAQRDAALRAPLYGLAAEAMAEVRSLERYYAEFGKSIDDVLSRSEYLPFLQRLNLLTFKLHRARSYLSLHNFHRAQYYLLSTRHDLRAMRAIADAAGAALSAQLVCD